MGGNPFTLSIPQADLELLRKKLEVTRLPDELDGAGWDYGVPLADVRRLVARWKDGFDWRATEATINQLPQFTRDIEVDGFGSLNIHYIHQKSQVENAIPLLFVHGWPGSFLEASKLLPLLTAKSPENPSFHMVVPSLPNFGFSDGIKKKGFALDAYAETLHKLMIALGYNEYVVQGGDWGTHITSKLAQLYGPKYVKARHTNYLFVAAPTFLSNPFLWLEHLVTPYTDREKSGFKRNTWFEKKSFGYNVEQATQPQTIGYSLADSPAGLLAWMYEKLRNWSDNYPWTDDEILTFVSIYWFSRAGPAASVRIYYESTTKQDYSRTVRSTVPLGLSHFPKEIEVYPSTWARTQGNVVFESFHDTGGHFAAHEQPEKLAGDLCKMFGKGGPAFGVVPGKNGYNPV